MRHHSATLLGAAVATARDRALLATPPSLLLHIVPCAPGVLEVVHDPDRSLLLTPWATELQAAVEQAVLSGCAGGGGVVVPQRPPPPATSRGVVAPRAASASAPSFSGSRLPSLRLPPGGARGRPVGASPPTFMLRGAGAVQQADPFFPPLPQAPPVEPERSPYFAQRGSRPPPRPLGSRRPGRPPTGPSPELWALRPPPLHGPPRGHAFSSVALPVHPRDDAGSAVTVDSGLLSTLRVVGQLDAKFIIASTATSLFVIDQHAADERVRLEALEAALFGPPPGGRSGPLPLSAIAPDVLVITPGPPDPSALATHLRTRAVTSTVTLTHTEAHTLSLCERGVQGWGWRWNRGATSPPPTSAGGVLLVLHGVPELFGHPLDSPRDLKDTLAAMEGGAPHPNATLPQLYHAGLRPPAVFGLLQSKACRGAVMFGDVLPMRGCAEILTNLAACSRPWACAHGRPSVLPLVQLEGGAP